MLGVGARPEHSLTALAELGIHEPALLTLVKWHDCNLPWWTAAERGQAPSRTRERRWVCAQELGELELVNPELEPILARALANAGAA